jgi:rhodanese-related sulfurtransferase
VNHLAEFVQNHLFLVTAFTGVAVALLVSELKLLTRGFTAVNPQQLGLLVNNPVNQLLDVAAVNDFIAGHIPSAKNVPFDAFDPTQVLATLGPASAIVVYARKDQDAAFAATKLVKLGRKEIYVLSGGLSAWQAEHLPIAKGKN